jgi:hypothetical protein
MKASGINILETNNIRTTTMPRYRDYRPKWQLPLNCRIGSSTCSTKELSIHLTKILSAVKEGQQKYCETVYSRSDINHKWILKNSKDLLDNLKSRSFSQVSSIKTFYCSTLYTTLPHDKLKTRLKETIHKAFNHRNYGSKCVVVRLQFHIFFKQNSKR